MDEAIGAAKVMIEDLGIETYWLPIPVRRMAQDQHVDWLDIGDRVGLLLDGKGEQGMIVGCYYDESNPPPIATVDSWYRRFSNGSTIEFDRTTGVLRIECERVDIVCSSESRINSKAIAVIGAMDNDNESSGPDALVTSGQL